MPDEWTQGGDELPISSEWLIALGMERIDEGTFQFPDNQYLSWESYEPALQIPDAMWIGDWQLTAIKTRRQARKLFEAIEGK